jgi:hypothetical protein
LTKEEQVAAFTSLVTSLAAGAAVSLQSTVEQGVKDGYAALQAWITCKDTRVNVDLLAQQAASESRRTVVKEGWTKADAATDAELLTQTKTLLDAPPRQVPEAIGAVGVNLHTIHAASLTIDDIIATGTGVKVEEAEISCDMMDRGVQAGDSGKTEVWQRFAVMP